MSFYPDRIDRIFRRPENAGTAARANAAGRHATFVCGAALRLSLRIDTRTKEIGEARFATNGCGYLIAAAEVLTRLITGRRLTEFGGEFDRRLEQEIERELGRFARPRRHCLELTLETLHRALADFRLFQIGEFAGEKALICTCFGVAEETIERAIAAKGLETVEQVGRICRAGTGCGSCQPLIQEILDTRDGGFG